MLKRSFDILFSFLCLLVVVPLLVPVGVWIKLDSAGPVLFRALRTGRNGKTFTMYKLRTMVVDAHRRGGPSTGHHDPRLTRVGFVLRRWKLDEFPQLFNVLKGDMSIVGPRPETPEYTRLYSEEEKVIMSVRPGITDYSTLEFPDLDKVLGDADPDRIYLQEVWPRKNQLRVHYALNHTFFNDLWIILLTLIAMIKK